MMYCSGRCGAGKTKLSLRDRSIVTVVALMAQGLTDSSFSVPSDNCKEQRRDENGNCGDPDPCGILCGLAQGMGGLPYGKGGMGGGRCCRRKKPSIRMKWSFPSAHPMTTFAKYFIGQSYLAPLSTQQVGIYNVTFEPGCRNNWHIHHAKSGGGQILVCVAGRGYYQEWGKPAQELRPGSVVNIPVGVKHWHGAAPDSWFSHLAVEVPGTKPPMNGWKPWTTQYILRQQARRSEYGKTEFNTGMG